MRLTKKIKLSDVNGIFSEDRKMKIALVHYSLKSAGGGERVCLSIIEALNKTGIIPDLYVVDPVDEEKIEKSYGKKIKMNIKVIAPTEMRFFGIYNNIFYKFKIHAKDYDCIVDTSGIYSPFLVKPVRHILYVYNPMMYLRNNERYEKGIWKAYILPYVYMMRWVSGLKNVKILSVSDFTAERIKKCWNKNAITVYPPVSIKDFISDKKMEREGVITIGRFTPEKNHIMQLEIASLLPELKFKICGSAETPQSKNLLNEVKEKAIAMGLKNVEFCPNLEFKQLVNLINHSRYFLHTMNDEDFGITVCEAIAGGCIPVIYNAGGPTEIVPFRELRFESMEEAARILKQGEDNYPMEETWKELFSHIQQYGEEEFQKKVLAIIELRPAETA